MKSVNWGKLYNTYGKNPYDAKTLEAEVSKLMQDEDVCAKKGIYSYIFDRQEKHLSIRAFSDNQKREAYERQKGICGKCGDKFELGQMEADHIDPWSKGGKTVAENCKMLCVACNRRKSDV
jgi:hypothetical protein